MINCVIGWHGNNILKKKFDFFKENQLKHDSVKNKLHNVCVCVCFTCL